MWPDALPSGWRGFFMDTPLWIEIEIEPQGDAFQVTARGSRGEHPPAHLLGPAFTRARIEAFTRDVGRAVQRGKPLGPPALSEAQALHEALFQGALRDVTARLHEAAKDGRLLHRLFLRDHALQAFPWEALCRPSTTEDFWGSSAEALLARGVTSADPWEPREVSGAVRLLAIAPSSDEGALESVKSALGASIEAGEIEWLDPIIGPRARRAYLFEQLRRSKSPHILHFLGHGSVDAEGLPILRLADDEDGEEAWIKAEALARELSANFSEDLRLLVLEACEGARPGAFGSAAELLAQAGADAVVAHLWPVQADVARRCSGEFYRSLTGAERSLGDVVASLSAARRTLLLQSAEGFSPVVYLRGPGAAIFSFEDRKVSPPVARRAARGRAKNLAPALQALLERPFSLVLGEHGADDAELRRELQQFLSSNGDTGVEALSLAALTQRCALRFGQEKLYELFQDALIGKLDTATPPLIDALGRLLAPGVHVTLLWLPLLERALAEHQPERTLYVIQPALLDSAGKFRVVKRAADASAWTREPGLPKRFELDADLVVLRLYGGYLPEPRPIFTSAMLTEDHHIHGLIGVGGFRPPEWADELLGRLRIQPGLFAGLSVLEWRHRMLLRWLYDQRPAPKDSLALLGTSADRAEQEIWESGGGLPGTGRIAALREDAGELAAILNAYVPPEVSR